ncbi:MAG: hypothetical protein LBK23_03855, partial [Oscillospiraceae bacterium]|nr:hypothetical protein [Oscillospiraceae bacterium]
MKTKRSFLPLRIAAATVLTLLFVFSLATNAADPPFVIELLQTQDVRTIEGNIQTVINSAKSNGADTVTVTGSKTGVSELLTLNIPANVKVLWQATYSDNGFSSYGLIQLSDNGAFEVGTGGSISSSSAGTHVIKSISNRSTVTISGTGKVQAMGGNGIAIDSRGNVEVKDEATVSTATGTAIYVVGANVTVSGGTVTNTRGYGIFGVNGSVTVTVSGGLVFAYGSGITGSDNVILLTSNTTGPGFTGASGTGVVIAWNKAAGNTGYENGTPTDISLSPASTTAVWDEQDGQKGIAYANDSNTGFIPLIPALTGEVTITGAPTYGETLTANTRDLTFEPDNIGVTEFGLFSYQWKHDDTGINDATEQSYTLVSEDVGQTITVTVTAENC